MKALIFGAAGQDGSFLSELLLAKGYKVYGVCRPSTTTKPHNISHLLRHPNFSLLRCDVTDTISVNNLLSSVDCPDEIYNLAAQSHVGESFKHPGLTWDATAKGCLNILQAIVDLNLHSRFYQASTSEMFGSSFDVVDGRKLQCENTKFLPQSPYAIAKCAAHYLTRVYREAYGVHASCGILFNHESERRGEEFVTRKITKWVAAFGRWLKTNNISPSCTTPLENEIVYKDSSFPKLRLGNLQAWRDWGYAPDFCEAMHLMLQQDNPDDYVICTGETNTVSDFLDVAFDCINVSEWSDFVVQDPKFFRPAEVDYLRGDNKKAYEKLGWLPRHTFNDLVEIMVRADEENLRC